MDRAAIAALRRSVLRRVGGKLYHGAAMHGGITVHGFRPTFRDWASEQASFQHETCEHALAHRISDKAEPVYRRGDQFGRQQFDRC